MPDPKFKLMAGGSGLRIEVPDVSGMTEVDIHFREETVFQKQSSWEFRPFSTVENINVYAIAYCLALWDEIFDLFLLFYETLRHIELCNSVISQIQRNPPKLSNSVCVCNSK